MRLLNENSDPCGMFFGGGMPSPARRRPGVSLVELMIALAILTIGVVGLMGSFGFIQKALQSSKNRTLASNLAQEKMQILKQKSYYQIIVTSDPAHNSTDFSPETISYDTGYFPPENITEAGLTYTRYTYIQVAREDSGSMVILPPHTPDTGMRLITITVAWSQGGVKKKLSLRSLLANPNTVMANAVFKGQVRDSLTLASLGGAIVNIAENMGYRDTADSSGNFSISLSPGSYTIIVSSTDHFTQFRSAAIIANETQTHNFDLVRIATGTVSGTVWLRDHLVISQVVGSSVNAAGFDQEWVEVYNPTTWTWTMATGLNSGIIGVAYQLRSKPMQIIDCDYSTLTLPPQHYFLFANTGTVTAAGVSRAADAVYDPSAAGYPDIIRVDSNPDNDAAGVGLGWITVNEGLDAVGWKTQFQDPEMREGAAIDQVIGLQANEQFVRSSRPCFTAPGEGRAYDTGDNKTDFDVFSPIIYTPRNSSDSELPYSGTPAAGAVVTASDGVSSSTEAWLSGAGCPQAVFTLVDVATGTWTVLISSGKYMIQDDTIAVTTAALDYVFPNTTALAQEVTHGIITGRVLSALGAPITSPTPIVVSPGGAGNQTIAATADGRYRVMVSSGYVDVTTNPGNLNSDYVSISSLSIPVEIGEVHSGVDFMLYQGGRISGFVTRDGINALPGIVVAFVDLNGQARDTQVSWIDGRFTSVCVPTGTYIVEPSVGSLEQAIPSSTTVVLTAAGVTKFSSTFTITGALGYITGAVTSGGQPIKTGVLIVVTTTTLVGTPPAPPSLSTATLAGSPYYIVSSMEDGTYRAEVRQSTSPKYNVYAYYPTPSGTSVALVSSATANVSVLAGQTTTGVNFSW